MHYFIDFFLFFLMNKPETAQRQPEAFAVNRLKHNEYFLRYSRRYRRVFHGVDSCECLYPFYSFCKCFRQKRERERDEEGQTDT